MTERTGSSAAAESATGSQPRWLDDCEQLAWRELWNAYGLLDAQLDRDLRTDCGLSLSEYGLLVRLSEQSDWKIRMAALADLSGISRSRLTHLVSRMEKRGLLERCSASEDGRGIICVMTQEGYRQLVAAAPRHVESVRDNLIDLLDHDELTTLASAFAKVNAHLHQQEGNG
ncbi:MarR family winged helix-turn-helix transcriptional regulator [Brevibacterium sp. 50QC2O2]|uniref:MarR family winged helix-turn-helix transcriptional regulator n=1 Tax=Brevibacterium TaxID=1696 RepID=UPI00211CA946|nr:MULTISPECIES: MarR family winged helix-turn-helix transcriptional regulator [unclassified Brevibacterium]MCQ9368235.1 MarR family winged helix-turn-helix transcriptional regulator [Brevibacterium sp. 91QC2O2]MCQ9385573.1 MarR family winged helix-turn-helix transcriptional regulator [Brevibacterium sp. 68QC2CO]MCQ9389214.1 MarR family winged helix-turn-helix transcriptional regulator [Brevibacterium sp. 50QC2O2]